MLKFQAQVYRINDISGWHDRRELRLAPDFQRRRVWSPRGRSYLIDSIVRGMPLPQFFVREIVLPKEKRTVREVIDGQQRISAILGYLAGEFSVLPMHNTAVAGLHCDSLPEMTQKEFLSFPLSVNILEGAEDADVLEIFARLNSYSVPLNLQERLNARHVGAFKQAIVELAKDHLAFWIRNKILTAQGVARMRDMEFTAELVGAMLRGLQNQKRVVPILFSELDAEFQAYRYIRPRLAQLLEFTQAIFAGGLEGTAFRRTSLFYSLYCALYDCQYGLTAGPDVQPKTLQPAALPDVQQQLVELSEAIDQEHVPDRYREFYETTRQSTDKLPQRSRRHTVLRAIVAPLFV